MIVTSVIVCESSSFSVTQMSDFRSWVSSPFYLDRVLDLGVASLFGRVPFALVLVFLLV
jgi:hypothetical protein